MPLKYYFHYPLAVKIFGWMHGALFITYTWHAFEVMGNFKKTFLWFLKAFAAALLPLGTFIMDRELKKEERIHLVSSETP
jgi:integral membrane protein